MPKFELTMTARYALDWGEREGVREIVQNMLDGHDAGYPMVVGSATVDGKHFVTLSNRGLVLDKSAWLLGKSDKGMGSRGRHGDGLKVGTLALIRQDVGVWFLNGDERWTPGLEYSETFGGEVVMVIQTRKGSARQNDFTVGIEISAERWEQYRQDFLPLADLEPESIRKGGFSGDLILDPRFAHRIFVKGIWVCNKPEIAYGYDLHDVTLDRDRRIMDTWDVQYQVARIQAHIAQEDKAMMGQIFKDLVKGSADVEHVCYHDGEIRDDLAALFQAEYGTKAVAVQSAAEATKVEHYGLKGVVVPKGLREVMEHAVGSVDEVVRKAMDLCGEYCTDLDLSPAELKAWTTAQNLLTLAGVDMDPALTRVYDFKVEGAPLGTYTYGTGEIRINRSALKDVRQATVTLAHELAHRKGQDGTLDHRAREEQILKDVIGILLEMTDSSWFSN